MGSHIKPKKYVFLSTTYKGTADYQFMCKYLDTSNNN